MSAHVSAAEPGAPTRRQMQSLIRVQLPNLHLRFSERKLLLAIVDLITANAALFAAVAWRAQPLQAVEHAHEIWWIVSLSILWLVVGLFLNIYDLALAASPLHSAWASGRAVLITSICYLFIPYVTPALPPSRLEAALFPLFATTGIITWRIVYAQVFVQPAFHQRALVIGAGWAGQTLARAISERDDNGANPYRGTGYQILGYIDDDPAKQGQHVEGVPVLGTRRDLLRLVRELHPDELILAITHSATIHSELFQAILDCRELGLPITTMSSLYERITGRVPVEHAGRDLYVVLPVDQPAGHRIYMVLRSILDRMVALAGCILLLALLPLVWLVNHFTAPGDVFYCQERVGLGGKTFQLLKFRSMVMDAEKHTGAVWATPDDPRVTPMGRILRITRLDELPQCWNILKGDMSLIGPRPERPEFVASLARDIPFYRVRHAVKPGVTGWAQVKHTYCASVDDSLVKLQYDLYYIKHQGPYLDLLITLKTIQVMLGLKGR